MQGTRYVKQYVGLEAHKGREHVEHNTHEAREHVGCDALKAQE